MKALLLILLALLAAAAAGWLAQTYGGEIIVHSGAWTVRMPLLVGLLILLGTGTSLYLLATALHGLVRLIPALRAKRAQRRDARTVRFYQQAVRETLEHRHADAYKSLKRALELRPQFESAHLLAAAVCIELRDWTQWQRHLCAATSAKSRPAATLLRLRGLCATQSWKDAMAILLRHPASASDPAALVQARMQCLRALRDWEQMLAAAQALAPRADLERSAILAWCGEAARQRIAEATAQQLMPLWKEFSEPVLQDARILGAYARALRRYTLRHSALEAHVRHRVQQDFAVAWVRLYAELPGPVHAQLLPQAQRWRRQRPDLPQLAHLCARLHMRAAEWTQARALLEQVEAQAADACVRRDLAHTLAALGADAQALAYYRRDLDEVEPET